MTSSGIKAVSIVRQQSLLSCVPKLLGDYSLVPHLCRMTPAVDSLLHSVEFAKKLAATKPAPIACLSTKPTPIASACLQNLRLLPLACVCLPVYKTDAYCLWPVSVFLSTKPEPIASSCLQNRSLLPLPESVFLSTKPTPIASA
jgi:hypothetical protein